jgi:hypothetical protein
MATIVTRELGATPKGSPLTNAEIDQNFINLNSAITGGDITGGSSSIDNAIVRYNGITGKIIQNSGITIDDNNNIDQANAITFDVTPATLPTTPGTLYWDSADGNQTLSLIMAGGTATQQIGEELYYRIKASAPITNGQVVMFTGTVGASGALTGAPATGLTAATASYVMGIATQDMATNDWGYVTSFGLVRNINTSAFTAGDILYFNPSVTGGLTTTIPTAPNAKVQVCAVIYSSATVGSLFVRPSFGGILGQYEGDVNFTSIAAGNLICRNAGNTAWENVTAIPNTQVSGLGTISTQNANNVTVTGGSINGTTLGATTPSTVVATTGNFTGPTPTGNAVVVRTTGGDAVSITTRATGLGGVISATDTTLATYANLDIICNGAFIKANNGATVLTINSTGLAVTGNLSATGTLTGVTDLTTTGNTILGNASTDTLNVGNGGLVKDANGKLLLAATSTGIMFDILSTNQQTNGIDVIKASPYTYTDIYGCGTGGTWQGVIRFYTSNNTAAVERMRIDSAGQLGVGMTTSYGKVSIANTNASGGLHLSNGTTDTGGYLNSTGTTELMVSAGASYNSYSAPNFVMNAKSTIASGIYFGGGVTSFWNNTGLTAGTTFNRTERMRIDSSGNVGIGITPTANTTWAGGTVIPALDMAKSSQYNVINLKSYSTNANSCGILVLSHSKSATIGTQVATANNDYLGWLAFEGVNSSNTIAGGAVIGAYQEGAAGVTYVPSRLVFWTSNGTTAPTERMRIDSNGVVSVGANVTTVQSGWAGSGNKLQISNAGVSTTTQQIIKTYSASTSFAGGLSLGKSGSNTLNTLAITGTETLGFLTFDGVNSSNTVFSASAITGNGTATPGASYGAGALLFWTSNGVSSAAERMRIDSSGNVNISGLTASQIVMTDANKNLVSSTLSSANIASLNAAQTFTAPQRGSVTTANTAAFDESVTNNFQCTPAATVALTFSNHTAGQSGYVLLINTGGYAITAAATTKLGAGTLAAISTAGTYLLSYFDNGTNAYVTASGALA